MRDRLREVSFRFRQVSRIVSKLEARFMATAEELQTALDGLSSSIDTAKSRINDDVTSLESEIENLKTELEGKIDPSALDPISAKVASLRESVDAIDPVPPEIVAESEVPADPEVPVDPETPTE